jgi:ATP-dependent exoDNAse (exonuclease V) beta subunit
VLSPRRLIANLIKGRLASPEREIAAHSFYNDKLLEPEDAQVAMTKLQLLNDADDRVALRYWLGSGSDTWRRGQYAKLRANCELHGRSPAEVLAHVAAGQTRVSGIGQLVARYQELQAEIDRLNLLPIADLYEDLFPAAAGWAAAIRELVIGKLDDVDTISGLLDLLRTEITQPEMPVSGDFVRIMSLHKSKGLTSRATIIVGCMRGLIPFIRHDLVAAERPIHFQEQRRLFYVALTRAKELLTISSAARVARAVANQELNGVVLQGGNVESGRTVPCEFLQELGPDAPAAINGSAWADGRFQ